MTCLIISLILLNHNFSNILVLTGPFSYTFLRINGDTTMGAEITLIFTQGEILLSESDL